MAKARRRKAPTKTGRMTRKGYDDPVKAKQELVAHGYTDAWTAPGTPQRWAKPGSKTEFAVQRVDRPRGDPIWNIVEYPHEYAAHIIDQDTRAAGTADSGRPETG